MNILNNAILYATAAKTTATPTSSWSILLIWGAIIIVFYLLFLRPQKKRQKEEQAMRENVQVGDQIITIGGISGKVIAVKEKDVVLETGADRNKITIKKWAIQLNETVHDAQVVAKEAAKKDKKEKKEKDFIDQEKDR